MLEPASGLVIAGKYRLQRQMGAGGMGSVWLAEHMTLGSPVAVKLLHTEIADAGTLSRFTAEAKAAARLRSPHVVQILDHGVDGETPFIVMERLEGESLGERLLRSPGPDFEETLTILTHTVRAVTRAHEAGIVHRDLKPDNIFLHLNDDEFVAKVLDFGIAKVQPEFLTDLSPQTSTGMLIGSPYYMSPEQAEGRRDLDWRSDLWALGIITYECMTGVLPYKEDTLGKMLVKLIKDEPLPPSSIAAVPEGFDAWFARANCKDRDARYQSAKEMLEAFRSLKDQPLVQDASADSFASTLAGTTAQRYENVSTAPGVASPTLPFVPAPGRVKNRTLMVGGAGVLLGLIGLIGFGMSTDGVSAAHETEDADSLEKSRLAPDSLPKIESETAAAAEKPVTERLAVQGPAPKPAGQSPALAENPAAPSPAASAKPAATSAKSSVQQVSAKPRPAPQPQPQPAVPPAPQPTTGESPKQFNPLDLRY